MSINNNYDFQREFSMSIQTRKECRPFIVEENTIGDSTKSPGFWTGILS